MPTIIQPVSPQPVVFAERNGMKRWCWGPKEPITDLCRGGNASASWWQVDDGGGIQASVDASGLSEMMERYCPIERPKKAKVEFVFDGDRWVWCVSFSETAAKIMKKEKRR